MQSRSELIELIQTGRPDVSYSVADMWAFYLSQLKGCHLYSVTSPELDKTKWLKARCVGIGGSEIAAIMGENSWSSPRQIWMSKIGALDEADKPQSEAARWGNLLETSILTEWGIRENRQWIHIPVSLQDDEKSYLLANIDGFTLSDDRNLVLGVLEGKTTSLRNEEPWRDGPIPVYYMYQTNWYCGITRLSEYVIVCLVGGQKLYHYELPADTELFAQQVVAADTFWNVNVLGHIEPEASAADLDGVRTAGADETLPALVIEDDESDKLVQLYCDTGKKMKALKDIHDGLSARIRLMLKGGGQAITKSHAITISTTNRRTCNFEKLADEFPEVYEQCVYLNPSQRMTIK